ncbi:MAG TPA: polysaccharide biosynthesis/export family protein [Bryobacteraceae bacterium]|nr:polysaccharide biosynthesis/export family protein [Bryobacteraceae bacterium]
MTVLACWGQASPQLASRDQRYLLLPGDVFEVRYRYTPEFNQTVTVQPDGYVSLILAGEFQARGLSVDAITKLLTERSAVRLRDPEVNVVLKEFVKPHFFVAGEVSNPGRFDLQGGISALQAVAVAGGLKSSAKHSQAILYRRAGPDTASAVIVDLKKIATIAGYAENVDLRPGDVLFVPQNRISKIERIVRWGSWGVFANPVVR